MTEVERRRIELLKQTRKSYMDKYTPAVHPRYRNTYNTLYGREVDRGEKEGTFGVRFVIAILLLGLFAIASKNEMKEAEIVSNEIEAEFIGFVDLQIFD